VGGLVELGEDLGDGQEHLAGEALGADAEHGPGALGQVVCDSGKASVTVVDGQTLVDLLHRLPAGLGASGEDALAHRRGQVRPCSDAQSTSKKELSQRSTCPTPKG
jgi:hypothetical protein